MLFIVFCMEQKAVYYHLIALFTIIVWGITLISTKILLYNGLAPAEIMLYRFIIAYVVLWICYPHCKKVERIKDEFLFLCMGLCGASLYFLAENCALEITHASNVALIVTTAPLLTIIFARLMLKSEPFSRLRVVGSLIALAGVFLVVFNGNFILDLNPLGDVLSLVAAVTWAFYSIFTKLISGKYPILLITRKVFFYGIVTILPYFLIHPLQWQPELFLRPAVFGNLLFLGVIASSLCFFLWNEAIKHLGAVKTNNYIYFMVIITMFTSWLVLHEQITVYAIGGAALILSGVYVAELKKH